MMNNMMNTKLNTKLNQYIREHMNLYVFVTILFLIGVGFGAVLVHELSLDQKQDLTQHLGNYFSEFTKDVGLTHKQTFIDALMVHAKWTFLIWVFGLSIIGIPLILILDFLKGVFVGFAVGYFVSQMSWKGLVFAIISLAPHNLIVIPALLICSVAAITYSITMVKNRLAHRRVNVYASLWKFTSLILCMALCLVLAAAWESYMAPVSLRWMLPKLGWL
jgi:stage II sporulation protein M